MMGYSVSVYNDVVITNLTGRKCSNIRFLLPLRCCWCNCAIREQPPTKPTRKQKNHINTCKLVLSVHSCLNKTLHFLAKLTVTAYSTRTGIFVQSPMEKRNYFMISLKPYYKCYFFSSSFLCIHNRICFLALIFFLL